MKRVAKKLLIFIASTTYVWLLFLVATGFALRYTIAEPDVPKQWLVKSGVYEKIVAEVAQTATIQQAQESAVVEINSRDVVDSAQRAFPSDELKRSAESVIDGFYAWFKGDTSNPEFRIDFAGEKDAFATVMATTLEQKISELPACEAGSTVSLRAFDPFEADCIPAGVDITKSIEEFRSEIASSEDFLTQTVFTGGDLKVHGDQRIGAAWSWVPRVYKLLLFAPWGLLILTVLFTAIILLFSTSKKRGLRRLAGAYMFTGVVLVISGLFLNIAIKRLNSFTSSSFGANESIANNIINPVFDQINSTYSKYNIFFGAAFIAIACIFYGFLIFTRDKTIAGEESVTSKENPNEHPTTNAQNDLERLDNTPKSPIIEERAIPQDRTFYSPPRRITENETLEKQRQSVSTMTNVTQKENTPDNRSKNSATETPREKSGRTITRRPPMIQG